MHPSWMGVKRTHESPEIRRGSAGRRVWWDRWLRFALWRPLGAPDEEADGDRRGGVQALHARLQGDVERLGGAMRRGQARALQAWQKSEGRREAEGPDGTTCCGESEEGQSLRLQVVDPRTAAEAQMQQGAASGRPDPSTSTLTVTRTHGSASGTATGATADPAGIARTTAPKRAASAPAASSSLRLALPTRLRLITALRCHFSSSGSSLIMPRSIPSISS